MISKTISFCFNKGIAIIVLSAHNNSIDFDPSLNIGHVIPLKLT